MMRLDASLGGPTAELESWPFGSDPLVEVALSRSSDGITVHDPSGRLRYANARAAGWLLLQEGHVQLADERGTALEPEALPPFEVAHGPSAVSERICVLERGAHRRILKVRSERVEHHGAIAGVVTIWTDVTVQVQADACDRMIALEHAALTSSEASRRRYELIARVGHLLGSRELPDALTDTLRLVGAHFGDAAVLDLVDLGQPGVHRTVEVTHPGNEPAASALIEAVRSSAGAESIRWAAGRGNRTRLHGLSPEALSGRNSLWVFGSSAQLSVLAALETRSLMGVPVRTRSRCRGFLTVLRSRAGAPFGDDDERLLEEIAARLGFAIERDEGMQRIRRAVDARDDFLAAASHELRTPLSTLLLTLQGMVRQLANAPDELPAWMHHRMTSAVRQANQLRSLIDRLMDVTRLASGRGALELQEVEVHALAPQIAEDLSELVTDAGCTLELDLGGPATCISDPTRLRQAITNLIENACKYARGTPIRLAVRQVEECVEIRVSDHGPGVSPGDRERIFERHERAAPMGVRGFGLGLYILRELVETLGGSILVDGAPGGGATFLLRLPPHGPTPGSH